jgi:hypothetical protein
MISFITARSHVNSKLATCGQPFESSPQKLINPYYESHMSEPHEAKWISAVVPIKEVIAFADFLSLVVSAKTSWRLYIWEDPHLYQNTKICACINGTVKKRSTLPICTWCRSAHLRSFCN